MSEFERQSRRGYLGLTGSALAVAVAGCTSSGGSSDGAGNEPQELRREDWEDVSEIELQGALNGFVGVTPDHIEGLRNPGLLLFEGATYDITWENADGAAHNLAIRSDDGSLVDDYETSFVRRRGESATLTVEATDAMHKYVCDPHPRTMTGYIVTE